VSHIYDDILGDSYWDPRIKLAEGLYGEIPRIESIYPDDFVGERILGRPELDIEQEISKTQLMGFIRSWSGYNNYCHKNGVELGSDQDPVETIIRRDVGDNLRAQGVWPVALLLSVKKHVPFTNSE
jgi:hypothetical protein